MRKMLILAAACGLTAVAQDNPMATEVKGLWTQIKTNIVKAAEKMPEEGYAFKATPDVRSFGQLIGHITDAHYGFCGGAMDASKAKKAPGAEKSLTSKADLVAALKTSVEFCDGAYNSLTDASLATKGKLFGRAERTYNTILNFNIAHDNEHYGNIVTYMRLKNLVPPSSEGR
ncbi:hypothetical protein F183_A39640 [Bryobacterales bacterium F-183]|nr:hypothetical protein F183_A39640 [Bryobacterales bacterium F-183]